MSAGSRLDHVYRSILKTKFFTKGWGNAENLKRLFAFRKVVSCRDACFKLVPKDYPISVTSDETDGDFRILEGKFISPFAQYLPGILPKEAETAHFQAVLPSKWHSDHYKPVCIHLAGTGDHGFWRRRQIMAKPLIRDAGIGALLLENPFYGQRKPKDQVRSSLHNVSDIFVMGGCLILECLALLHWCENNDLGPLGLTGISMGGHMASLAATNWPKPIALVPCLSWSTASAAFIDDAFRAGQHFAKHYPKSMDRINELQEESQKIRSSVCLDSRSLNSINVTSESSNYITLQSSTKSQDSDKTTVRCSASSGTFIVDKQRHVIGSEVQSTASNKLSESSCVDKKSSNSSANSLSSSQDVESNTQTSKLTSHTTSTNKIMAQLNELKLPGFSWRKEGQEEKTSDVTRSIKKRREYEALQFMRGIMDECTHLRYFSVPVDTSLIIAVCARDDAYVPRDGCTHLADIWPGAEIRYVDGGHVSAYVLYQNTFRAAIKESFERLKKKYYTV